MSKIAYIFYLAFLVLNVIITYNDVKYKKIANKYILYLSFFSIVFIVSNLYLANIDIGDFLLNFFLSFIISFGFYYFGLWGGGDTKYIFLLSLISYNQSYFSFLGNIGLIILIYLTIKYIYFYFIKIFNKDFRKYLFSVIKIDKNFLTSKFLSKSKLSIFYFFFNFLIIFSLIRFIRFYIFSNADFQKIISEKQEYYLLFIVIFIIFIYGIFYLSKKLNAYLEKKLNFKKFHLYFNTFLFFILIFLIYNEYKINPVETINYLKIIFTYYLLLYIFIKLIIYLYKVHHKMTEEINLDIKLLRPGLIVDKEFMYNMFGRYKNTILKLLHKKKIIRRQNDWFFKNFENPIDKKTYKKIKKIYRVVNNYNRVNKTGAEQITYIKILKTFSFAPFIFIGFLINFFYGNQIILFIYSEITKYLFN